MKKVDEPIKPNEIPDINNAPASAEGPAKIDQLAILSKRSRSRSRKRSKSSSKDSYNHRQRRYH